MVKIFLNGCCGRMGKAIAGLCYNNPDYKIVAGGDIISNDSYDFPVYTSLNECNEDFDVIIDFSNAKAVPAISVKSLTWDLPQACDVTTATLIAVIEYTNQNGGMSADVDGHLTNPTTYYVESDDTNEMTLIIPGIVADGKTGHILNVSFNGSHGCAIVDHAIPTEAPYMPSVTIHAAEIQPIACGDATYDVFVSASFTNSQLHDIIFKDWLNGTEQHVATTANEGTAEFTFTGYDWDATQTTHTYQVYFVGTEECADNHLISYSSPSPLVCERDSMTICEGESYPWHGVNRTGPVGENKFEYRHTQDAGVDSLWLFVKAVPEITVGTIAMTCDEANEIRIPFTVSNGNPDSIDVVVDGVHYEGTIDGTDITFSLPTMEAGDYAAQLHVGEHGIKCETTENITFTIALSGLMYSKWTDVLFINNKEKRFTGYQWYADGAAMGGETLQRLYDPNGLSGTDILYHCRLTTTDGKTLYTCPQRFDDVTPSRTQTTTTQSHSKKIYDTMGRSINSTPHNGIYIVREEVDGEVITTKIILHE